VQAEKCQNRAAYIITFSSYDTSAAPLFEQLNWKRVDTQRQIQVATMVYKSIHGLAPNHLGSLFTTLFLPYKNIFYKNIEADIREILRIF